MKRWKKTAAVLVCAGSGSRMGGSCRDKLLLELAGKPVAAHALMAYDQAETIQYLVVVTREELIPVYQQFQERYRIRKPLRIVAGGGTRSESALRGVRAVPEEYNFIAIGDGARPLIASEDINATVRAAWDQGAAALGCYLTDTVKKVKDQKIVHTIPREQLVAIQTPQVFPREEYLICATAAQSLSELFTDDASIFEKFGKKIAFVEGNRNNIKITAPEDIPILRAMLEGKRCE